MAIDHKRNKLPSSQESVVLFGARCYSRLTHLLKEVLKMILLNASAIPASSISKSGKDFPPTDCDVTCDRQKIPAISTSLIHDIVSSGVERCTCTHIGLEADSPTLEVISRLGMFQKCNSEIAFLGVSTSYNFEKMFLRYNAYEFQVS